MARTIRMLRAFLGLAIVLAREAELHQFLAHRIGADRMPHGGQDRGQFVHALRHPQQRAHGIAERGRFEEALQCGHETGISRGDSLAAGAGTPYLTFRQFLAIEIVLAAIDGRTGKPGDPRDHRKPAPAGRSHLARREHPPPAFVKLRADHVPAIANRNFIDHAIRDTSVRLDPESRCPELTRRTPAHRDLLIVRGGLRRRHKSSIAGGQASGGGIAMGPVRLLAVFREGESRWRLAGISQLY